MEMDEGWKDGRMEGEKEGEGGGGGGGVECFHRRDQQRRSTNRRV